MENKLDLKHLAPYLPYGLKVKWHPEDIKPHIYEMISLSDGQINQILSFNCCSPILKPMSDLHANETIKSIASEQTYSNNDDYLIQRDYNSKSYKSYQFTIWLIENHFDVFGLIEKGLAIDINTIEDVQTKI